MPSSPIVTAYDEMKNLFGYSPLDPAITEKFEQINRLCSYQISLMSQIPIKSRVTAAGKNYVVFSLNGKYSRPVNIDLYNAGTGVNQSGTPLIIEFWNNVKNHRIANQSSKDITSALYTICMNYCCCADLLSDVKNNSGDYFEKLVGHLYSMHLQVNP